MNKVNFKPGTLLSPLPLVMASLGESPEEYNIITIAWTGIINSEPPMTYLSIRPSRHSHKILLKTGEFVINLTPASLAKEADYCGVRSGRDENKFETQGLTPIPGLIVKAPLIEECPINLECRVIQVLNYPSHDMFVAEILKVHADETLLDPQGRLMFEKAGLLCYSHGEYYGLTAQALGFFGFSVMKPKTQKRKAGKKTR
jgi:flavin reductase (DIM6/NTAB) family NADH-FMN oxidoreductase RutF